MAQNVEAADVEQRLGRTLMPRFHAGFSIGTVAGALAGAGCARLGVGVPAQLIATAVLVATTVIVAARWFLPVPVHRRRARCAPPRRRCGPGGNGGRC